MFGFGHYSDFGRSDFGIPLYLVITLTQWCSGWCGGEMQGRIEGAQPLRGRNFVAGEGQICSKFLNISAKKVDLQF